MNFRSTALLFGFLLGMLWLFGLTVAYKKTAVDASFLMPTLQANTRDYVIDSITIKRRLKDQAAETIQFNKDTKNDVWMLTDPVTKKSVKLETFRVEQIANQIKDARRSDDASVTTDLGGHDLVDPPIVVTLKGTNKDNKTKEWKFNIGKESPNHALMFVNTSDLDNKVYAVTKNSIDSVLFKDPNHLRARRVFEFSDTAAQTIDLKEGNKEVTLKKGDDLAWRFEKPALGFADFEGPPPPKDLPPGAKAPSEGGVKGLLAAIGTIRVDSEDDFIPLSETKLDTGLEEGKEKWLIQVGISKDVDGKKTIAKESLAIGNSVKGQVYARLLGDQGVFKINAKLLEPLQAILQNPGTLRSLTAVNIDTKKVDAVTVEQKSEKVTLLHPENKPWELQVGSGKPQKANEQAIQAMFDAVQGKREIVKFYDGDDYKKLDAEMKSPLAVVTLYLEGLEPTKKIEAKDTKVDKKDEIPQWKKDAKPAVTLSFAGATKDNVNVQRVLADGTNSRFMLPRAYLDKVIPGEVTLAYLDATLPELDPAFVEQAVITREKEKMTIERGSGERADRWFFKEGKEPVGKSPTDPAITGKVINLLSNLTAKKWLHKLDPKEDLEKYGLKKPSVEVTLVIRKDRPAGLASLLGLLATPSPWAGFMAETALLANRHAGSAETINLKIGKETEDDKDKPAVYAQRSDKDMLFLLPGDLAHALRDVNLHDRAGVINAQPLMDATLLGLEAASAYNHLLAVAPLFTNQLQEFDPAKVKELKIAVRSREELRVLAFQRDTKSKDKDWRDQSGLQEFSLDSQKVNKFIEELANLKVSRWVSLVGGVRSEQKLTDKEATIRIGLVMEDGKSITLSIGTEFERLGYYAWTNAYPEAVFLLAPEQVTPWLQGPGYFGKERVVTLRE